MSSSIANSTQGWKETEKSLAATYPAQIGLKQTRNNPKQHVRGAGGSRTEVDQQPAEEEQRSADETGSINPQEDER